MFHHVMHFYSESLYKSVTFNSSYGLLGNQSQHLIDIASQRLQRVMHFEQNDEQFEADPD